MESVTRERVAEALEPKLRGFGQGEMPMAIARELSIEAIRALRIPSSGRGLSGEEYAWNLRIDDILNGEI